MLANIVIMKETKNIITDLIYSNLKTCVKILIITVWFVTELWKQYRCSFTEVYLHELYTFL